MPGYEGPGLARLLPANRQMYMWDSETVSAGEFPGSLSLAYQLERLPNVVYPWGCSFQLAFSGNPGTFEVDIVGADTDASGSYIELAKITNTSTSSIIAGNYVYRYDMASNLWPKYVAGYLASLTNAVTVSLQATR